MVLRQVSIHNQNQETGVEELGHEHFIRDGRLLLTGSVVSDPLNELDNHFLQDNVDCNDDKCN